MGEDDQGIWALQSPSVHSHEKGRLGSVPLCLAEAFSRQEVVLDGLRYSIELGNHDRPCVGVDFILYSNVRYMNCVPIGKPEVCTVPGLPVGEELVLLRVAWQDAHIPSLEVES
ncbi:hypothetical protein S40285_09892 [Stachybotrys chlorohalonatus IBT 40285]|uniref:Uncharacterized protein n=1 Tax=Stachybotrys chlorohalonatus (strain IBT 40285) TaxID=1283841 RepID=A0A084QR50_STAC4|nr:hypothetical protein S40285_09892 [Stachybotrys chlorohalonata IBT 40285]